MKVFALLFLVSGVAQAQPPLLVSPPTKAQVPCDYSVERFETKIVREERFEGMSQHGFEPALSDARRKCTDRFRLDQCDKSTDILDYRNERTYAYIFGREIEKVAKSADVIRHERCQKIEACEVAAVNRPDASVKSIELFRYLLKEYQCE